MSLRVKKRDIKSMMRNPLRGNEKGTGRQRVGIKLRQLNTHVNSTRSTRLHVIRKASSNFGFV